MATYFEGGVDYFPKQTLFTPNWNLIQNVLETKQSQYDKGFEKIRSLATSMMNSPMLNKQIKERRDQYMKVAEDSLKNLPNIDLSIYQNVSAATSVFKPLYDDEDITTDIYKARSNSSEIKRGLSLRDSDKEEERKRYWNTGIEDVQNWADDYANADIATARQMNPRRYSAKPQTSEVILKMMNDGKIKMSKDRLSGMYKYTDENGRQLRTPLTNLFIATAQGDPESLEGYQAYGRVERHRFIKEKTLDGTYGTKEDAAKYYDDVLVQNHQKMLNKNIAITGTNITSLERKIEDWKTKLASGAVTEQSEFDQAIQDAAELKQLKMQKTEFESQLQSAPINIKNDPERYVGQVFLHKSAADLAEALSEFGTTKIDSNPIYKDFVFPIEMENLKAKNAEALARLNSQLKREEEAEKEKKDADGSSSSSSSSSTGKKDSDSKVTRGQLDVPIVSDNVAGSGILKKDPEGQGDAYQYNIDLKWDVMKRHGNAMFDFIEKTYGADPWIDPVTNKPMTLLEKKQLLEKGGDKLTSLYQSALSKYDDLVKVNNPKNLNLINELSEIKERKDRLNDVWGLADTYLTNKRKELAEYLKGSSTIPGSSFLYDYLLDNSGSYTSLLGNKDEDINKFIEKIKKTPRYKDELAAFAYANGQYDDPSLGYITMGQGPNWITIPGIVGKIWNFGKDLRPMLGQTPYPKIPLSDAEAEEGLTKEYKKAFTALRGEFLKTWNKNGWLFTTENVAAGGAGGGGLYSKAITFTGSNKIQGEQADVLAEDFISKAGGFVGDVDDFRVVEGTNEAGEIPDDDEKARKLLYGELLPELTKAIKAGDGTAVSTYNITYSPIGGNDPNYHAYTFTYNMDKVEESGEVKPGAIRKNITVYVSSKKDNTLFASRSSIGEIDYALKTSKTGNINKEIRPGYKIDLNEQARGNYTMTITYPEIDGSTGAEVPKTKVIDVPAGGDVTTIYYGAIRNLKQAYDYAQQVQKNVTEAKKTKPDAKVFSLADFEKALKEIQ